MSEKKRDWGVIGGALTGVAIAVFFGTYAAVGGASVLGILLIVVVLVITMPFGILLGLVVSRWLGFRRRDFSVKEARLDAAVDLTYHAAPKDHWTESGDSQPYLPTDFADDGFIHCTDSADALPSVLTTYYRDQPGDWVVLMIDKKRVTPPVLYDDPDNVFPHIYGPLNRDAIVDVRDIARSADGTFLPLVTT